MICTLSGRCETEANLQIAKERMSAAKEEVSAVDEEMGKLESAKKAEQKQSKVIVRSVSAAVVERQ